jgi:hypothetical protein
MPQSPLQHSGNDLTLTERASVSISWIDLNINPQFDFSRRSKSAVTSTARSSAWSKWSRHLCRGGTALAC